MAAGAVMAMCCDYRYAVPAMRFSLPEANLAMNFPAFATRRLKELVGEQKARDLLFTGKMLRAKEAAEFGLIDEIYEPDEFDARVRKHATKLANLRPNTLRGMKASMRKEYEAGQTEIQQFDIDELTRIILTPDTQEAVLSLIEKRRPRFVD